MKANRKQKGFSLFEVSVSAGLFFLLLGIMYPNILLFQKSYFVLTNYVEFRFQERELKRLIHQLLFHSFPHSNVSEEFFILEELNEKWGEKGLEELEKQKKQKGRLAFFSCLFWRREEKLVKNIFFLYFQDKSLYLAEYHNGVFHTGNKILLLENVEGYFEKEEGFFKVCYWKIGKEEKREIIYEAFNKR